MGLREELALNASKNVSAWVEFMATHRLKHCTFNLGPYPSDDANNANVGMYIELLEDRGCVVTVSPSVVGMQSVQTHQGGVANLPMVITIFIVKTRAIQLVHT